MASATLANAPVERVANGRIWQAVLVGAIGATIANIILRIIGVSVFSISDSAATLTYPGIIGSSVFGAVAGGAVYWLLGRTTRRPITIFRIVAAVVTVLSLGSPIAAGSGGMQGMETASSQNVILLIAMHIVTAFIITYALTTLARER